MSIASVVRRGYSDNVNSVVTRGFATGGSAPVAQGVIGTLNMVAGGSQQVFSLGAIFTGPGLTFAISPSVPAGASFDTATGDLTWNPTTTGAGTFGAYTVTATNSSGSAASDAFSVIVAASASSGGGKYPGLTFKFGFGF